MIAPRRLCVGVDLAGFSARTPGEQADAQIRLGRLLDRAWSENTTPDPVREGPVREPRGSGEVALPADGVDESEFVSGFVRSLRVGLRRTNRAAAGLPRLRLRVAMHTGAAAVTPGGIVGGGFVRTTRLLDCAEVRGALAAHPSSDLVLIVSQSLFEDVVSAEEHELVREDFSAVRVERPDKAFTADAAVHVAANGVSAAVSQPSSQPVSLLALAMLLAPPRARAADRSRIVVGPPAPGHLSPTC